MPYVPKELQDTILAAAPSDLDLSFKPMFGGIMAYADGKPFASLSKVGLALKVAGRDREELGALKGAKPLQYRPDLPVSKTYVVVPKNMLSDEKSFRTWIARSVSGLKPKSEPKLGAWR